MCNVSSISAFLKGKGIPKDQEYSIDESAFFDVFIEKIETLLHQNISTMFQSVDGSYSLPLLEKAYDLSV